MKRPMFFVKTAALITVGAAITLAFPTRTLAPGNVVSQDDDDEGWVTLFDGESLEGWTESGGRYDGDADWTVEDGAIVGREAEGARGGLLYTTAEYDDFEFECDVKITAPFDSGIFVRMKPKERGAQFTLDDRPGGEICGIYSDGWVFHGTGGTEAWRTGEWCKVRVRCVGDPMHLVAWIDGERVLDYRIPEGYGEFAKTGKIGVQVHGNMNDPEDAAVRFKNVRVREIEREDPFSRSDGGRLELTSAGEDAGWEPLFDGETLEGWVPLGTEDDAVAPERALEAGYRAKDGELQALMNGTSGAIRTSRTDWKDFELRMDFRIAKLANSGLYLRSVDDGSNASFNGTEVQILDDFHWEEASGSKLRPYQFTGGLYGAVGPTASALRPIGEWNTYEVFCVGTRMHCALNGVILWDVDTRTLEPSQGPPFSQRSKSGFIGMQRHGAAGETDAEVGAAFRNIFIRELDVPAAPRFENEGEGEGEGSEGDEGADDGEKDE